MKPSRVVGYSEPVIDLATLLDLRRPGLYRYAKAGVLLLDLYQPSELPVDDLFASRDPARSQAALMAALDSINGTTRLEDVLCARS